MSEVTSAVDEVNVEQEKWMLDQAAELYDLEKKYKKACALWLEYQKVLHGSGFFNAPLDEKNAVRKRMERLQGSIRILDLRVGMARQVSELLSKAIV
jgi:hypothetical protein